MNLTMNKNEIPSHLLRYFRPVGHKPKDLIDIPHMAVEALRADGWYYRCGAPWTKRSSMPESVTDRPSSSVEYVFLLTKRPDYYYDIDAVRVASAAATLARDQFTRISGVSAKDFATGGRGQRVVHDHETPSHPQGRNRRNGDWWFESLGRGASGMVTADDGEILGFDVTPEAFAGAHFATMPTRLVEPCVLAGTSEAGCCGECGSPWRRVTERGQASRTAEVTPNGRDGGLTVAHGMERTAMSHFKYNEWLQANPPRTIGWQPTCSCPAAPPRPCTILDPFAGSGTTLLTARRLGRSAVGCDLSADYLTMAERRIAAGMRPVSRLDPAPAPEPLPGQLNLFDSMEASR